MFLTSIMHKNLTRKEFRKKSRDNKIDIIFCVDDVEYFNTKIFVDKDSQNSKPISYNQKLFRKMKNQLDRLLKKLEFTKESVKELKNIFVHRMTYGSNYKNNIILVYN